MRRIFVSEYVCSGAWPDGELPESLASEGRSMLLALLEDAARNPEWEVHTTWDRRLGDTPTPGVTVVIVDGQLEEQAAFDRLTRESDATYVIAPELDDLLAQRCQRVISLGGVSLNSSLPAISLCSDKLALARRLEELQIPTLPTQQLDSTSVERQEFPVVVKPRFGAGSHETWLVETGRDFNNVRSRFFDEPECRQAIVQPFVDGTAVSVAALFDERNQLTDLGPAVEQRLSEDGRFTFLGGQIPARVACDSAIRALVRDVAAAVPGLRGYVGFDVLLPNRQPSDAVLVEVNPRLTTSYLGYRALTADNLSRRILQPQATHRDIVWAHDQVQFATDGVVQRVNGINEHQRQKSLSSPL